MASLELALKSQQQDLVGTSTGTGVGECCTFFLCVFSLPTSTRDLISSPDLHILQHLTAPPLPQITLFSVLFTMPGPWNDASHQRLLLVLIDQEKKHDWRSVAEIMGPGFTDEACRCVLNPSPPNFTVGPSGFVLARNLLF